MPKIIQKYNELNILRDPIWSNIVIREKIILELIATNEFQRLRFISHLGHGQLLFPSATHTRFSHSLGTYEVARRILEEYATHDLSAYEQKLVVICALLHDIGHGPWSHTFENISPFSHENIGQKIITTPNTDINKVLQKYERIWKQPLVKDVYDVLNKTYKNQTIFKLISSDIDVDRIDYLLRDSYVLGVSYGNFDWSWLFRSIIIKKNKIYYDIKSVGAIEHYLLARFFMYKNIYNNPKLIACDLHIKQIFTVFYQLPKQTKVQFLTEYNFLALKELLIDKKFNYHNWLFLTDSYLYSCIHKMQHLNVYKLNILINSFLNNDLLKIISEDRIDFNSTKEKIINNKNWKDFYIIDNRVLSIYSKGSDISIIDSKNNVYSFCDISQLFKQNSLNIKKETVYYCDKVIKL